jgi:plasmid maintenance system antidote protein VapI
MSAQFWIGLQMDYDLETHEDLLEERLKSEVKIFKKKQLVA